MNENKNNTKSEIEKNKKKIRCSFEKCKKKPAIIVGHCKTCNMNYCSKHRLPESHLCNNIKKLQQDKWSENKNKLMKAKCITQKIEKI